MSYVIGAPPLKVRPKRKPDFKILCEHGCIHLLKEKKHYEYRTEEGVKWGGGERLTYFCRHFKIFLRKFRSECKFFTTNTLDQYQEAVNDKSHEPVD